MRVGYKWIEGGAGLTEDSFGYYIGGSYHGFSVFYSQDFFMKGGTVYGEYSGEVYGVSLVLKGIYGLMRVTINSF